MTHTTARTQCGRVWCSPMPAVHRVISFALLLVVLSGASVDAAQDDDRQPAPTLGDVQAADAMDDVIELLRQRDRHIAAGWTIGAERIDVEQARGASVSATVRFPPVLTAADALRHAAMLNLSDTAKRSWLERFADYQQDVIDLQRADVEAIHAAFAALDAPARRGDQRAFMEAQRAFRQEHMEPFDRALRRAEERLYGALNDMPDGDDRLDVMTLVGFDRDRVLRAPRLRTMIRGAKADLIQLADDAGATLPWRGERGRIARSYLEELVGAHRDLWRVQERAVDEEQALMRMQPNMSHAEFAQRRAEIRRPLVDGYLHLARINHSYLNGLADAVNDEAGGAALRQAFLSASYPEIHPDRERARFEEVFESITSGGDLTDAQRDAAREVKDNLENWYAAVEPQAEEMVFDCHAEIERTMASHVSVMDRYRRELSTYLRERRTRVNQAIEQLREIVPGA